MGVPCSAGATCGYSAIESGIRCTCDPSGHYFCDPWSGGGAPPSSACDMETACNEGGGGAGNGGPCSRSNGWCTRSCTCAGCELECTDNPPASEEPQGVLCNLDYCSSDFGTYGRCEIKDGTCDYMVDCLDAQKITGTCPDSN
ncbi:hypothetical protein [Polyangium sp. y55x31]|uniref:hypothetical protein n=1 Tax=Polyangium sp. y55x31 TaxID=3042688 RepID=UPI002482DF65|nr:hypothetical protein [Polyangium sp. y55x31]MDI1476239.1 hypothetical protein [Polyangium sp. y55x31]